MAKHIEIAGKKYGRLTAVRFSHINSHRDSEWLFACDCGKAHVTSAYSVTSGKTRSCGCLKNEMAVTASTTHGLRNTRIYETWSGMRRRCLNPKRKDWPNYGGRGITVCSEWNDFKKFYDWAMSNGYSDNLSIDRIDNNMGYSPENCQWVGRTFQNNNTRANRQITAFGKTKNLQQWADDTGINHSTITLRLRSGWTPEDAVSIIPVVGSNTHAAS